MLELGKTGIHVAEYMTELPPREVLEQKLHSTIRLARQRLLESKRKNSEAKRKEGGQ